MNGRGAWSAAGVGGTLQPDKTTTPPGTRPGPYYMLAVPPDPQVGSGPGINSSDINTRAVHWGVRAIQRAFNRLDHRLLQIDGIYGPATTKAIRDWQSDQPLSANTGISGGIGPASARALFTPWLRAVVIGDLMPLVYGITEAESSWDPGAVGYFDPEDYGLTQINGPANKTMTEADRFDPAASFSNAHQRLRNAIAHFKGDVRTAVASYNLGVTGATAWRKAGSPDWWTPNGSVKARNVTGYIDRITHAYEEAQ